MEKFLDMVKNTPDTTYNYSQSDIEQNRLLALISYLSFLCLVPLLMKKSAYATYHAKQGLTLAIIELVLWAVLGLFGGIPLIGFIFRIVRWFANLAFIAMSVLGILNCLSGKAKELPFIGGYTLKF